MRIDLQNAIILILCLVLMLTVFSLSSSASPDSFLNITDGGTYRVYQNVDTTVQLSSFNGSGQVYLFHDSSTNRIKALLTSSDASGSVVFTGSYFSINSKSQYNSVWVSNSYQPVGQNQVLSTIPSFASNQDAVNEFLSESPDMGTTSSFQYSLPPGNVAYIEFGGSSAIKLTMDFPELSNSFGTPFHKANSAYSLVDSLPTVGSSVASGTIIPWEKSGRLNLIGQTSVGSFGPIGPIATRYISVINPSYYDHVLVTGTYRQNPSIQIEALNVLSIHVFPLQSEFSFNNDTGQITTTIAGDSYVGDVDLETGELNWTAPDGSSSAPPLGGNNLPEAGNSIFDTLRSIASDFSDFLKGPVSAIRVVVSSIRDFLSSFTQLYIWLPSPVYNLITSALMIALTIGVVKIFV